MANGESSWKDRLGIAASALCAVHCAATPILLAFLPTLQFTEWMASPMFHQVAALLCCSLVAVSIFPAFSRHRDYRILGLSTTGLSLILGAAFLLPDSCCTNGCCTTESHVSSDGSHDHSHAGHDHSSHLHAGHDHGEHDHAEEQASSDLVLAGFSTDFWARVQPWMTPLGGVLLILAHFLNLRRGFGKCQSQCGCEVSVPSQRDITTSQAA